MDKNVVKFERFARRQSGFTLIELMISLALGLLVVAAASGLFIANRQVYAANETINRMQESARTAFELMSRDVREAGATPCMSGDINTVNMLVGASSSDLWRNYSYGLIGVDGGGTNPDSVTLFSGIGDGSIRITKHTNPGAELTVNRTGVLKVGDVLVACNPELAVIFTVTSNTATNGTSIQHNQGNNGEGLPRNADNLFYFDNGCLDGSVPGNTCHYCFVPTNTGHGACGARGNGPAMIASVNAVRWEIRDNGRNGRSLFRVPLIMNRTDATAGTPMANAQVEVAEGVSNMQLTYKLNGSDDFVSAASISGNAWRNVEVVQMVLTLEGVEGSMGPRAAQGVDGQALVRTMSNTVAIRNREGVL